ncbi:PhaM family polyhydroxyalkanoate granule multifunctional regulatory protein [Limnohabitans sp.]|uniref:PhaM family polyhydroxyalkanoate granule multifunctional regulatory protein n=1 Tax=Limnohabitans sp. TaxID=1907725 RepID=UPI002B00344D|nr:PhaM family polyhydroxyalkanoate granule multifunctional regulatory protein [Limnohabitans sp.]
MSDSSAFGFGKFVPGFDFLQNLSNAAAQAAPGASAGAVPGMASWVAPTLSIEDIDKRIQELKSVLFWLEQNTTALKATIQAMEVQKMTLSTLQSMNVNMADLAKAFTVKAPAPAPAPEPQAAAPQAVKPQSASEPKPVQTDDAVKDALEEPAKGPAAAKPAVDPMQWWGALTQQFQNIAAAAVKDVAAEAMKTGMTAKGASTSAAGKKPSPAKKAVAKKSAAAKTKPVAQSAPRKAAAKRKAP